MTYCLRVLFALLLALLTGCGETEHARQIYVLIDLSSSIDGQQRRQQLEDVAGVLSTVELGDRLEFNYVTDSPLRSGPPPTILSKAVRWYENPYTTRKRRAAELDRQIEAVYGDVSKRLSELADNLQEYMEDYVPKFVPRNRPVYVFFDIYDLEEERQ